MGASLVRIWVSTSRPRKTAACTICCTMTVRCSTGLRCRIFWMPISDGDTLFPFVPTKVIGLCDDRTAETGLRAQHAHCRALRPGWPARRRAGDGPSRVCLCRPHVFQRILHRRCAGPEDAARGELHPGTGEHVEYPFAGA